MYVIAVVSAKGGVGKTTISANLGAGIAQRGRPALIVDLDPQNAMQWHLGGLDQNDCKGISALNASRTRLEGVTHNSPYGVRFTPYGNGGESRRLRFEAQLEKQDDWLLKKLQSANLHPDTIVLLDTPPGPSVYLKQAVHAADFLLVVMLADAASYSTLPEMEDLIATYGGHSGARIGSAYIINQGAKRQLAQDVLALFAERLGNRMVPFVVPESAEVEEALAFERPILEYKPTNPAAENLQAIIDWLLAGIAQRS
ncbi:cellulose biosynthesis protein BcsQ [Undibacterium sp. SXout11W]|uniref:cellulose biosynthesis protein BcsQ n=1 Tax=Undibacterium sp. SXout11W TaxID=3413050 RepID=UPI003BEF6719